MTIDCVVCGKQHEVDPTLRYTELRPLGWKDQHGTWHTECHCPLPEPANLEDIKAAERILAECAEEK